MARRATTPQKSAPRSAPSRGRRADDASAVVDALRRLFRATQEYSKAVQSRSGLSAPQLRALQLVDESPGLSIGDLSQRMFAHPSTVSGVVDRLESRGAIERAVDEQDRRGVRLTLTARGKTLLRRSPQPVQSGVADALASMPRGDLERLRRGLDTVVRKAEAARGRPRGSGR